MLIYAMPAAYCVWYVLFGGAWVVREKPQAASFDIDIPITLLLGCFFLCLLALVRQGCYLVLW